MTEVRKGSLPGIQLGEFADVIRESRGGLAKGFIKSETRFR